MGQRGYNFDKLTELKDSTAVTSSAAAQVAAANKILDMGAARFEAVAVINVTAIDIASGDERYQIVVQGSNSSTFASGIENLGTCDLGHTSVRAGGAATSTIGQYEIHLTNEQDDAVYRYIRLYHHISGTGPTITYSAYLTNFGGR